MSNWTRDDTTLELLWRGQCGQRTNYRHCFLSCTTDSVRFTERGPWIGRLVIGPNGTMFLVFRMCLAAKTLEVHPRTNRPAVDWETEQHNSPQRSQWRWRKVDYMERESGRADLCVNPKESSFSSSPSQVFFLLILAIFPMAQKSAYTEVYSFVKRQPNIFKTNRK